MESASASERGRAASVIYDVAIPGDPERVVRVRSSIGQCLQAAAVDPGVHAEIERVSASLLELASGWAGGEQGRIAIQIEARGAACTIGVEATTAAGKVLTLTGEVGR